MRTAVEEPPPPEWDGFSGADEDPGDWAPPAGTPQAPAQPNPAQGGQPPAGAHGNGGGDPNAGWAPAGDPGWGGRGEGGRDWGPRQQPWTGRGNTGGRGFGGGDRQRRGGGRDRFRGSPVPPEPLDPRAALARTEKSERAFLAYCLALPDVGEQRIADWDIDDFFSTPATRQAAAYLRGRLNNAIAELPSGDNALAHIVAALRVQADMLEATPAKLELEALQLELYRLERHISQARITGATGVRELATERQKVLEEIRHRLT